MAKNIQKVPFPDFLLKTPCTVNLNMPELSEDGAPQVYKSGIQTHCIYSEYVKRAFDKDGKTIYLSGTAIVKGDIAPKLKVISDGDIIINGVTHRIFAANRARNPDGTVHHTEFSLI